MNEMDKISIVTISYNQCHFLQECICSVLEQQHEKIEYIVVDPGSTDGSRDLIKSYGDKITKTIFEPDDGPADGLAKGFAQATGSIFAYLNADDRFAPGAFSFAGNFFSTHHDIDVLCGAINIIDGKGKASLRKRTADLFNVRDYAAGICTVGQQATFFRADAYRRAGGFNPKNKIIWDGELLVDLALSGARFEVENKVLGDFRIYEESITGSQRHKKKYDLEMTRLQKKIADSGVALRTPLRTSLARLTYKTNFFRHLKYLTAR